MKAAILCGVMGAAGLAGAAHADTWSRDPASVPLPPATKAALLLTPERTTAAFAAAFDAMAPDGALFLAGPGTTPQIVAAADRARIYLAYMQYDLDGDGLIARAEYDLHADVSWGTDLDEASRAVLEREWGRVDKDSDAVITQGELQAYAAAARPAPAERPLSDIEQAIMGMDLDNDSFVRWDEVEAVLSVQ